MNERIKALMGQTLDEKFSGTWSTMDMQDLQKFTEKFAELVIKRCCEIADEAERADVPVVSSKFIKAHFGVK